MMTAPAILNKQPLKAVKIFAEKNLKVLENFKETATTWNGRKITNVVAVVALGVSSVLALIAGIVALAFASYIAAAAAVSLSIALALSIIIVGRIKVAQDSNKDQSQKEASQLVAKAQEAQKKVETQAEAVLEKKDKASVEEDSPQNVNELEKKQDATSSQLINKVEEQQKPLNLVEEIEQEHIKFSEDAKKVIEDAKQYLGFDLDKQKIFEQMCWQLFDEAKKIVEKIQKNDDELDQKLQLTQIEYEKLKEKDEELRKQFDEAMGLFDTDLRRELSTLFVMEIFGEEIGNEYLHVLQPILLSLMLQPEEIITQEEKKTLNDISQKLGEDLLEEKLQEVKKMIQLQMKNFEIEFNDTLEKVKNSYDDEQKLTHEQIFPLFKQYYEGFVSLIPTLDFLMASLLEHHNNAKLRIQLKKQDEKINADKGKLLKFAHEQTTQMAEAKKAIESLKQIDMKDP